MQIARFLGILGLVFCLSHVSNGQLIADFCFCDPSNILHNAAGADAIAASPNTRSNGEGIYNNVREESLDVDIPASIFEGVQSVTMEFDFYNQKNVSFLIYAGGAEKPENDVPNPFHIGHKAEDDQDNGNVGLRVTYYTTANPQTAIESDFIPNSAIARGERATIVFIYDHETGIAQLFKNGNLLWETPADQRTPGEAFYLKTKVSDDGEGYLTVGYNMNRGAPNTPSLYSFRAYDRACPEVTPPTVTEGVRCGEGPVILQAEAPGVSDGNYRWYADQKGVAIEGEVNSTFTPTLTRSTTYYVSVLEGPCESKRVPVSARLISPSPPQVTDQQRCEPGVFTLQAQGAEGEGGTYQWYASDGVTPLDDGNQAYYTTPFLSESTDFYVAAVTEGCESERVKVSAQVLTPPPAPTPLAVTLCQPGVASLSTEGTTDLTYRWYDQPTAGTLLKETESEGWAVPVESDTTFYVSAWNGACESERIPAQVTILDNDDLDAGQDVRILPDGSAQLQATAGYARYEWYPPQGLSNPAIANPIAKPAQTTTYWVTATSASGCEITNRVTVEVADYPIPNAFTPNGDGLNDRWEIPFVVRYPGCKVSIYNRWGEMIYYSEGYHRPWDGRQSGQEVVLGRYTYKIDLGNGDQPIQGSLMVLK